MPVPQLHAIHDATCEPAFEGFAVDLLKAAESNSAQGFVEEEASVMTVLESLR